jgi:hypothetical protein
MMTKAAATVNAKEVILDLLHVAEITNICL